MNIKDIVGKKIAVGFFGISYRENYNHWMGWSTNIDWNKTNYKDSLLRLLKESDNEVHHFFSTYHSEKENELLSELKPRDYKFTDFVCNKNNKGWIIDRHNRFKETINLFTEDYDYYIMTRFDLSFNYEKLLECEIKDSGVNVTSKHGIGEDTELICDYFYVFNGCVLKDFQHFINNLPKLEDTTDIGYYHKLHRYENSPKFNYMIDGSYYSHNCPVWKIMR